MSISDAAKRAAKEFRDKGEGAFVSPAWIRGFEVRVDGSGVGFKSLLPWGENLSLKARFSRFGRQGLVTTVPPQHPVARAGHVELPRAGLTEWYRLDEKGIEQGFVLAGPAPSGAAGAPLSLEMRISGPLAAGAVMDGSEILFPGPAGQTGLRYRAPRVTDASGRLLESTLSLSAGSIRISIQDAPASYPLTVDSLLTAPDWTSSFGSVVAGAGDVNGDGFDDVLVSSYGTA